MSTSTGCRIGYIYEIRNVRNNAVYLGRTKEGLATRWRRHRNALNRGTHHSRYLQRAWSKYGPAAFEIRSVAAVSVEELERVEQAYLDRYFGHYPRRQLYNMSRSSRSGTAGKKWSKTLRKRMSEAHIGFQVSDETKNKIVNTWDTKLPEKQLISPTGQMYRIRNVRKFCREHGLEPTAISALFRGQGKQHKGWSPATGGKRSVCVASPSGEIFTGVTNLKDFCRRHELNYKCMHGIISGRKKQWRGWTLFLAT